MKRGVGTLISVAGCIFLALSSREIAAENPYQAIAERNVFGLKPPPPPPDPEATKEPPPNIFLTGITTVLGGKRAFLKTTPPPGKRPGEQGAEQTYMLTEGQRDGDVEVLKIDEVNGVVKIRLAGKEMDLDFENNGVKIASTPLPSPGAAAPRVRPGFPTRPVTATVRPSLPTPIRTATGFRTTPTMPSRRLPVPGMTQRRQ